MADKVSVADVLKVLAKHAPTPNDPDDAKTLSDWNEQQAESQEEPPTKTGQRREG